MNIYEKHVRAQGVYNYWKSWNFVDATGKFNRRLKYDYMLITEPNLVVF